ncbi:flavin monoamine oxidase family protein [Bailinhaonella thermotolerans]|uniref:NAD(P)/FAD-dependent oxidoreductase n=1 Tax=Bailinhaonella thermotolerans TaxID=1070861 RepID=A0A3A4A9T4_9ACTN|nr:NAD(P)/FAD-dependent oxidoreductase [Bailinhaonella thermotolerans]RJL24799.1 NAD(P)/FAD-dependent oxidoreductase [Bailinhaonella thermotolerans]
MARTSPMRILKALTADHAAAERLRVPVAELRGMRAAAAEPGLGRRELLRRAAAAGIAASGLAGLSPAPARAADEAGRPPRPARIAVVGGGIAGLTAALTLKDAGAAFTLYEANPSRLGGRIHTQRTHWANGQTSEIGGELIDVEHKKMLELCRRFGLRTLDFAGAVPPHAEETLHFNGEYYPRAQADEDFKPVYHRLRADLQAAGEVMWDDATPEGIALDRMSIREWIETRVPGGMSSPLGRFIDVAYVVEYGAETELQSSLALILLMGYQPNPGHFNVWGLSDERYRVEGGNDRLTQAMAAALPAGSVRMGHRLVAVRANADGTQTLTFDEGGTTRAVTADHTILTVPLPILQGLDLSRAGFDPRMTNLLRDARMGYCTKLNMQFTARTWLGEGPWPGVASGDCFTDLPFQQVWETTRGQAGATGVLIQYAGGDAARRLRPATAFPTESDPYVRALADSMLTGVDRVFPGTKAKWNGRAQLSAWHENPYALGAYSYWPVAYLHRYAGYEGTRQGNVHIGGEHTSYDYQGFMNGGATEGQRAAEEVLADLRA